MNKITTSAECDSWLIAGRLTPVEPHMLSSVVRFVDHQLAFTGGTYIDWSRYKNRGRLDRSSADSVQVGAWLRSTSVAGHSSLLFYFPGAARGFRSTTDLALTSVVDLLDWPPHHNFCFGIDGEGDESTVDVSSFVVTGYGDDVYASDMRYGGKERQ